MPFGGGGAASAPVRSSLTARQAGGDERLVQPAHLVAADAARRAAATRCARKRHHRGDAAQMVAIGFAYYPQRLYDVPQPHHRRHRIHETRVVHLMRFDWLARPFGGART